MEAEDNQNEVSNSESRQSRFFLIGLVIAVLGYLKREIWMGFHFHSQIAIYFILVGQFLFFSAIDTNSRFKSFLKENLKYCVTYTWIAGCVLFLFLNFERLVKLELNSVGDMLAGMFAPLAMYWIIEAYRQQQKDLSYNRKSLDLQIEELQNSVEATRDMAGSAQQELKISTERHDMAKRADDLGTTPYFSFKIRSSEQGEEGKLKFRIEVYSEPWHGSVMDIAEAVNDSTEDYVDIKSIDTVNSVQKAGNDLYWGQLSIVLMPMFPDCCQHMEGYYVSDNIFSITYLSLRGELRRRKLGFVISKDNTRNVGISIKSDTVIQ
jgi:hypothetical protein